MDDIRASFMDRFFKFQVQLAPTAGARPAPPPQAQPIKPDASDADLMVGAGAPVMPATPPPPGTPVRAGGSAPAAAQRGSSGPGRSVPKVGRNDPCPCGSGKKYKKCHGAA
jgi:preprotein translocase subunit SecA